jgi:hypothetical protein
MQRRKFIALAGGGIVLAASAAAVQGGWFSAALPDAAVEAWHGSRAGLDPVKTALSYAITAPNPHNLQPWIADLRASGVIRIYTDPSRILPHTDPLGRQITIGHGAFLELLVMALAAQGLAAEVQLWPEGELPAALGDWQAAAPRRPVAMLKLTAAQTPSDPLFAQVLRRRTVKADFDATRAVSAADLQLLLGAAGTSLKAAGTVDSAKLGALRELCWQAAQVEINTERTVMESIKLVRVGPGEILQHRDGITVNTPSVRMLATLGLFDRSKVPAPGSACLAERPEHPRGANCRRPRACAHAPQSHRARHRLAPHEPGAARVSRNATALRSRARAHARQACAQQPKRRNLAHAQPHWLHRRTQPSKPAQAIGSVH